MINKKGQGGMGQTLTTLAVVVIIVLLIYFSSSNLFGSTNDNIDSLMSCGGMGVGEGNCRAMCLGGESSFKGLGCGIADPNANEEIQSQQLNATYCCIKVIKAVE
jgi:hypothetical protein